MANATIESGTIEAAVNVGPTSHKHASFGCWICGEVQPLISGGHSGAWVREYDWPEGIAALVCPKCATRVRANLRRN